MAVPALPRFADPEGAIRRSRERRERLRAVIQGIEQQALSPTLNLEIGDRRVARSREIRNEGEEAMVASLRVESVRKQLMMQERRCHIVPWKTRPGVVDSRRCPSLSCSEIDSSGPPVQDPAGDKKAAARNLDDHVHPDPHRLLQGRDQRRARRIACRPGVQDAQGFRTGGGTRQPIADMGRNVRCQQEHPAIVDIEASPAILCPEEQLLKLLRIERRSARIEHADEAPALLQKVATLDGGRTKLGGKQIVMRDEHAHLF